MSIIVDIAIHLHFSVSEKLIYEQILTVKISKNYNILNCALMFFLRELEKFQRIL